MQINITVFEHGQVTVTDTMMSSCIDLRDAASEALSFTVSKHILTEAAAEAACTHDEYDIEDFVEMCDHYADEVLKTITVSDDSVLMFAADGRTFRFEVV